MTIKAFKIGDKVVCPEVPEDSWAGGLAFTVGMKYFVGQVGEVVAYGQLTKSVKVFFPSTGEAFFFRPQWIVHHKEPDEEEFKIGDKVYCREVPADTLEGPTFQPIMEHYLGEVGEITGYSKVTGAFKVVFPSTGKCFFFMPKWLTKISFHKGGYATLTKPDAWADDGVDSGKWLADIPKPNEGYLTSSVDEKPAPPPKWRFGRFRYTEPSRMVDVVFEGKWEKGNVQGR